MNIENLDQEALKYLVDNGMLNMTLLEQQLEMKNKKELLSRHQLEIWQGNNGYWYTYLPDEKKGRVLKKKKSKSDIENLICEYYKVRDFTSFGKLYHEWIAQKLEFGEVKKQTCDRYDLDFERFFVKTGFATEDIRKITEVQLEEFIKRCIKDFELTNKAYSGLRTIIIGVFKYAKRRGYTEISPKMFFGDLELSKKAFKPRNISDEESVFTKKEVELLQDELMKNPCTANLGILLVFQTGLRIGELAALQYSDIDWNRGTIKVWKTEERFKDEDGKTVFQIRESPKTEAGNRNVILDKEGIRILDLIRRQNPFGEYLFLDKNGNRMKAMSFTYRLLRLCKKVGIEERSMHKIRKTYATRLINGHVDEKIIMKQLGHTDIGCTKHYYYYNDKDITEASEQIHKALSV